MNGFSALAIVFALVLAGCGADDEPLSTGAGPGDGASLVGDYRSVEVREDGEPRPLVDDTVIALQLDEERLSASAGCNNLGGSYSIVDGVLRLDGISTTEMGCDEPRMSQDRWLTDLLTAAPAIEKTDDGLLLSTATTSIRFVDRELAEPDVALVGTTWTVTGFIDGETAMSSAPPGEEPGFVVFEENGFVTGFDGCNDLGYAEGAAPDEDRSDLGLTYEVDGDRISFEGDPVQTLRGCDGDYVGRFRAVLTGTVEWTVEASNLTLLAADGRGVTYTASG